ncbi:MAG: hypothetical protein JZU50_06580, partial [Desulfobulbaceae bacterium]|nr:hypothetical protein [Desulfobulbaceae bacterium]
AIVAPPLPAQLEQLQLKVENIITLKEIPKNNLLTTNNPIITTNNPITTNNQINSNNYTDLLAVLSEKKLFTDFVQAYNSFDNMSEFLITNGYARQENMEDKRTRQRYLEKRTKNISVNQKKNEDLATLSFGADNAQEAGKLLNEYLNFIQTKEVSTKNKLLAGKIASQINALNLTYQVQEAETLKRLQEDITRTEFALRISKTAGIETPIENLNNQSIFAIDLGSKALNEKLKILKEIKKPEIINPTLAEIRLQLNSWLALPQEKVSFTSYHFLQSPSEPLIRNKPKRSLIVALATLSGLMMGVVVAMFRANWLFRNCKKNM